MDRRQLLRAALLAPSAFVLGCTPADREAVDTAPVLPAPDGSGAAPPHETAGARAASTPPDEPVAEPHTEVEPAPANAPQPEPDLEAESESATRSVRRIEVICRDALGLAAAGAGATPHTISRVTLHHSAVPLEENARAPSRLRSHQRYHQDQGWADIAYHYGVDLAGNVYELRDPATAGDTFTDYDPASHLLIVCEGDYDQQQPTDALLDAVASLVAYGAIRYGLPVEGLAGHRDEASTGCPGDGLYQRLGELRAAAAHIVETQMTELALVCGDEGRARVAAVEAG